MTIHPEQLPRLGELARSSDPDDRDQAWEMVATLTQGDTCTGCGARLDPEEDVEDAPDDGTGWFFDVTGWLHVCGPGSPPMRAQ